MKAIVYQRYGSPDVLELRDVEEPAVSDEGILIRVHAASVNRSDWETLTGRPAYVRLSGTGLRRPKRPILGSDFAGRVEAVGAKVTRFQPGDEVFGDTLYFGMGAFAEFVSVPERAPLALKPPSLSFEDAATLPQAAVLGLQGLRYGGGVEPGHRVVINGAGGGAGSFAVQIAKTLGAEVTAVDNSAKIDMMRSLGADHVMDYRAENYTKGGRRYDRILDFAAHRSVAAKKRALDTGGISLVVGGSMPRLLESFAIGWLLSRWGNKTLRVLVAKPNNEDLARAADLVEAATITPFIGRRYALSEVPDALRHLGAERALGKLVVTL